MIIKLNSKVLIDFVKCIEKAIKKPRYIFFKRENHILYIVCREYDGEVIKKRLDEGDDFHCGVEANEFMATIKKLNEDELTLKFLKKKLELTMGNIIASYGTIDLSLVPFKVNYDMHGGVHLIDDKVPWILDALVKCADSVETILKDDLRFRDILLCSDEFTYMTRFTEAAVCVLASENVGFKGRIVIPVTAAKVAKTFKNQINLCFIDSKYISLVMGSRMDELTVCFPLMQDNYPEDCLSFLHLNNEVNLLDINKLGYWFNRDHLVQAIDLVSSVMKDEGQIKFELVGQQENGFPVWKISSSNFKGSMCEETIENLAPGNLDIEPFWINGKKAIKAIQSYGESVVFYDHSRSVFALANDEGKDLTLLAKSGG